MFKEGDKVPTFSIITDKEEFILKEINTYKIVVFFFTKANTSSASYIIIIGENEFNGDFFTIKNLTTGEQKELKLNQIFNHLNDKSR